MTAALAHLLHLEPLLFEQGDRLTRQDFLCRWESMPNVKRAELIDGVVYMPSPVSLQHSVFLKLFFKVLSAYEDATPGCQILPEATWVMLDSAPQPDLALCLPPKSGDPARSRQKYATGAPELIVEITLSSRSYDLGPKLALYQRAGVQEYAVALIEERRIEWRALESGSYRLLPPDSAGVFRSLVFPGLRLDSGAFWREDRQALLETLKQGLLSAEHEQFVKS